MAKNFSDEVIKEFTKENDIVLYPFLGLGTTAISCVEQNRHFIGFEICETYCEVSKNRIEKALEKTEKKTIFDFLKNENVV
jgi:DNA modification methylase